MGKLKAGQAAPDFELESDRGGKIKLSDYRGKSNVVLYFYPRDNTPGCTREACDFQASAKSLAKADTVVFGVSADSLESHAKFRKKYKLSFPLLSDPDKEVIKKYGVWQKKSLYGKSFMGIVRMTFLIDKQGKIRNIYEKVKVEGHVDEVHGSLKEWG